MGYSNVYLKVSETIMIDELVMWTVYDHPLDYPDHYVARKFICGPVDPERAGLDQTWQTRATSEMRLSATLDELRDWLGEQGLYPLLRNFGDEPQIVETWI